MVGYALASSVRSPSALRRPPARFCFFFFPAEDGIRDVAVTGVQTCALPISLADTFRRSHRRQRFMKWASIIFSAPGRRSSKATRFISRDTRRREFMRARSWREDSAHSKIGRASWRERGEISVGAVSLKKKKRNSGEEVVTNRKDVRPAVAIAADRDGELTAVGALAYESIRRRARLRLAAQRDEVVQSTSR